MSANDALRDFCSEINTDLIQRMSQFADDIDIDNEGNDDFEGLVLLQTYKEKCSDILKRIDEKDDKDHVIKILKEIAQLVLDVTYVKEIYLVENDFPEESAESDIKSIMDSLTSLEVLSKSVCPDQDVVSSLGPEILECLRWRKGALLYMFCHTLHYQNPDKGIPSSHLHHLEDGVGHLVSMLKTRCDAKWLDSSQECENKDDSSDTLQLIEQGIFSDTHILALMYCGEMCYWHVTSSAATLTTPDVEEGKTTTESEKVNQKTQCDSNAAISSGIKDAKTNEIESNRCENSIGNSKGATDSVKSLTQCNKSYQKEDSLSKILDIGNSCLKKYISITSGPLASAGWGTDRAEDIIGQFQNLKL